MASKYGTKEMSQNIILGLHGGRGVGKDTVADHLVAKHGFVKIAFADKIREECASAFKIDIEVFTDDDLKNLIHPGLTIKSCRYPPFRQYCNRVVGIPLGQLGFCQTPRWILQYWADYRKSVHGPDIYVVAAFAKILRADKPIVLTDIRTENEAILVTGWLKANSIGIIRICNPRVEPVSSHHTDARLPHEYISATLQNETDKATLFEKADILLEFLKFQHEVKYGQVTM